MNMRNKQWMWAGTVVVVLLLSGYDGSAQLSTSHDYFTVNEEPGVATYFSIVEEAHTNKIMGWLRNDRIDNAFTDCKYVLERFPNHPKGLMLLEHVSNIMRVPNIPIAYYEKALKEFPQYALTHAQFGRYLAEIGQVDEGIARLKRAIEMDQSHVRAYVWIAEAYKKKGDGEQASRAASKAKALGYAGELPGGRQLSTAPER